MSPSSGAQRLELTESSLAYSGAVIVARGEFETTAYSRLRDAIVGVYKRGADPVVIDLSALVFPDSVVVAALAAAAHQAGEQLIVVAPAESYIRLVLDICGPPASLLVVGTRAEAEAEAGVVRARRFVRY